MANKVVKKTARMMMIMIEMDWVILSDNPWRAEHG
jgi:hypothetical protein